MIKVDKNDNRGITLVTLSIAIIIMLIITSTLIYNITTGTKVRTLNNMYQDITKLKDKVDLYYSSYNTIPILETKYENVTHIQSINPNDNDVYYVIDLESLENVRLNYGKEYETYKTNPSKDLTDLYIINERSHSIYYVKGIEFDNRIYYTIPGEHTKIETNSIANLQLEKMDANVAVVKINAVDKTNGIKQIKLFVNDKEHQVYDYTSNSREMKKEVLNITLPFGKDYICYLEIVAEDGSLTKSNETVLKNNEYIATADDLKQLATLVNAGTNSFEGQTITLMNDIDLKGSQTNQWTPIGSWTSDGSKNFKGTFNGNNKTISGLYINTTKGCQGLFGINAGTIMKVTVSGTIVESENSTGGIAGDNRGNIELCVNTVNITSSKNNIGGITGINKGYITKCRNEGNITSTGVDANGHGFVGGIAGINQTTKGINQSYNTGTVTGVQTVGGITGGLYEGLVENCYNKGNVSSNKEWVGGIAGLIHLWSGNKIGYAKMKNCYNIGTIATTGAGVAGDIWNKGGPVNNCYYLDSSAIRGYRNSDVTQQVIEVTLKTQAEMKQMATTLGNAFKEDSNNKNEGYPILVWQ